MPACPSCGAEVQRTVGEIPVAHCPRCDKVFDVDDRARAAPDPLAAAPGGPPGGSWSLTEDDALVGRRGGQASALIVLPFMTVWTSIAIAFMVIGWLVRFWPFFGMACLFTVIGLGQIGRATLQLVGQQRLVSGPDGVRLETSPFGGAPLVWPIARIQFVEAKGRRVDLVDAGGVRTALVVGVDPVDAAWIAAWITRRALS